MPGQVRNIRSLTRPPIVVLMAARTACRRPIAERKMFAISAADHAHRDVRPTRRPWHVACSKPLHARITGRADVDAAG